MKKKQNYLKKLKELKKEEQLLHKKEVNKIVEETYKSNIKIINYNETKKLQWYDYLLILLISSLLIGFSFLISIFGFKNIKKTDLVIVSFLALTILLWLILGWYKNKTAAIYFNDSRKRYHSTFTYQEAYIKKIRKQLVIVSLLLIIISIIVTCIF